MTQHTEILWGKSSADKERALANAGIVVDKFNPNLDEFSVHVPGFEQWPLIVDAAGNVTPDAHNPAFAAGGFNLERRILLNATQDLASDLWGCESAVTLDGLLKESGWGCYSGLYGLVTATLDDKEDVSATIFGRNIELASDIAQLSELARVRINRALTRLVSEVTRIHQSRSSGLHGDISAYIDEETRAWQAQDD